MFSNVCICVYTTSIYKRFNYTNIIIQDSLCTSVVKPTLVFIMKLLQIFQRNVQFFFSPSQFKSLHTSLQAEASWTYDFIYIQFITYTDALDRPGCMNTSIKTNTVQAAETRSQTWCHHTQHTHNIPQDPHGDRSWHQAQSRFQTETEATHANPGRLTIQSHLSLQTQKGLKQKCICHNKNKTTDIIMCVHHETYYQNLPLYVPVTIDRALKELYGFLSLLQLGRWRVELGTNTAEASIALKGVGPAAGFVIQHLQ